MNEGFTSSELLLLDTDDMVDMGLSAAAAKRFKQSRKCEIFFIKLNI